MRVDERIAEHLPIRLVGIPDLRDVSIFMPNVSLLPGWQKIHPINDRNTASHPFYVVPASRSDIVAGRPHIEVLNALRQMRDGDQWVIDDLAWHCYCGLTCFESIDVYGVDVPSRPWWAHASGGRVHAYAMTKMLTPGPITTQTAKWCVRVQNTLPTGLLDELTDWYERHDCHTRKAFAGTSLYPVG